MATMDEAYIPKTEEHITKLGQFQNQLNNLEARTAEAINTLQTQAEEAYYKQRAENAKALFNLRSQLEQKRISIDKVAELAREAWVNKQWERENAILDAKAAILEKQTELSISQAERAAEAKKELELRTNQAISEFIDKRNKEIKQKEDALAIEELKRTGKNLDTATESEIEDAYRVAAAKTQAEKDFLKDTDALQKKFKKQAARDAEKAEKDRKKKEKQELKEKQQAEQTALVDGVFGKGHTMEDRKEALKEAFTNDETGERDIAKGLGTALNAISSLSQKMEKNVDDIGKHKSSIDTRMWGSKAATSSTGSYFEKMSSDFTTNVGFNGYVLQADLMANLETMVAKGIAHNVEQRAFLSTLKDKIATTFNAADSTLLRLVRIQQQDTTAGRLGMEAALNSFLNNMYETTEYLSDVAASVRSSLEEMESLMSGAEATEIEFQVQKWMGSMYSVGMSQNAVQGIADALGKVAAGDVSALTGGGNGNLMVMAANEAGISIADVLADGLDADQTNKLMQAMVNYLAEIADSSSDSRVVQQQLANVYGLKASDLRAAKNLADKNTISSITNNSLTYNNMLNELNNMANSMLLRTSVGEIMSNVWENAQYSMAANMANSPISYLTYKMAGLLESTTGGIAIPAISVMGNMVDLHTTVADLMRVGSMVGPVMKSLGGAITGLAGTLAPSTMLSRMGIGKGDTRVQRGSGGMVVAKATSGASTSSSGIVGNSNSDDMVNATMAGADDDKKEKMVSALEEETVDLTRKEVNENILNIYKLLLEVADGDKALTVQVRDGVGAALGMASFEDTPWGRAANTRGGRSFTLT